jgi:penicillin-binding protein 1A
VRSGWRARLLRRSGGALLAAGALVLVFVSIEFASIYFDRRNLPDPGAFKRFEFPTTGHLYDADGRLLSALAREHREITRYNEIPTIVRDAVLAAEDKRFFSHNGIDYLGLPRVLSKVRVGRRGDLPLFPQGGSTITQQLVRGVFLSELSAREKSHLLRPSGFPARLLSPILGARSVNMLARKREEMRLSLWLEREMEAHYGSKRRAKEEILARYVSFVYMGKGQYGFATAAEYYFGQPLTTFEREDADKAAVLAGITKSPRDYAPTARNRTAVLRRRNQTLALMVANGVLSREDGQRARSRALGAVPPGPGLTMHAPSVVGHVLEELTSLDPDLGVEDLLQGRIHVYSTVDARIQRIVDAALEHGLARYEARHKEGRGVVQGSVVVLHNRDGRILAETGGRQVFEGREAAYSDYNRVTQSRRQPGSAMKPIVYLAAFSEGALDLDTVVPDEPISVSNGLGRPRKWISNYDGRFKGPMPVRIALAESRNAVAIWIVQQIGIDGVLRTAKGLDVRTPLARYPTTALGASEMSLIDLANAYRTMASGIAAEPHVIRSVVRSSGEAIAVPRRRSASAPFHPSALSLIQEGLRGVVRLPTGTAHRLTAVGFPIAVMGKTGTTNEFRDAVFVGSTYGPDGMTAAVRIGFDDNRSLGPRETGGRLALPVFEELMRAIYRDQIVGVAPAFPARMEQRITDFLRRPATPVIAEPDGVVVASDLVEAQ